MHRKYWTASKQQMPTTGNSLKNHVQKLMLIKDSKIINAYKKEDVV